LHSLLISSVGIIMVEASDLNEIEFVSRDTERLSKSASDQSVGPGVR
jgi:hypothetical protein